MIAELKEANHNKCIDLAENSGLFMISCYSGLFPFVFLRNARLAIAIINYIERLRARSTNIWP